MYRDPTREGEWARTPRRPLLRIGELAPAGAAPHAAILGELAIAGDGLAGCRRDVRGLGDARPRAGDQIVIFGSDTNRTLVDMNDSGNGGWGTSGSSAGRSGDHATRAGYLADVG